MESRESDRLTNVQFIIILVLFAVLAGFNLFSLVKSKKKDKNGVRYSKKIVAICLIVMTVMMTADIVLCWRSGEQLDSQSVTAIAAFWGTEVFASAWIRTAKTKQEAVEKSVEKYTQPQQPEP